MINDYGKSGLCVARIINSHRDCLKATLTPDD